MKKTMIFRNEKGFTLIEIIAVLVIMGILAAVAVPKFFDLQERAKEKAVSTAFAEMKVRVNQRFASWLLDGATAGDINDATKSAAAYTADEVGTNLGDDFEVTDWTANTDPIVLSLKYKTDDTVYTTNISKPIYE
jgi:prepilin-type N-terminal cleavage/methylation domain-containing protein